MPQEIDIFPHPLLADEDGLLALGGRLDPDSLILAYSFGIFPWNHPGEPVLWWYTHPRCVLIPSRMKIARSMRPYLNGRKWHVTFDRSFDQVIRACRNVPRKGQGGTWITPELETVFLKLHDMGYAHSVEVWEDETLVAGAYGMAIGKIFFGESMFTLKPNASKYGFIKLAKRLEENGFLLIDCQQKTDHLISLGAEMMDGKAFLTYLKRNTLETILPGKWY